MTFALQIRQRRDALALTQLELARLLQVSSQTVSNWESARCEPWPRERVRYLALLNPAPARPRVSDRI